MEREILALIGNAQKVASARLLGWGVKSMRKIKRNINL